MKRSAFEWAAEKDRFNRGKHGIAFEVAQYAFADPDRVIAEDLSRSKHEQRYFCFGKVDGGIMTVRKKPKNTILTTKG